MIIKIYRSGMPDNIARALINGVKLHGHKAFVASQLEAGNNCDVAVFFGFRNPKPQVARMLEKQDVMSLVMEMPYFRPPLVSEKYYQLGVGQLNWLPPREHNLPSYRFEALNLLQGNLRGQDGHVLLCGQVPEDAQHHFKRAEMIDWLYFVVGTVRQYSDRDIIYRPHPKLFREYVRSPLINLVGVNGTVRSDERPLVEDLRNAWAMVTYNSTSGNEALLNGIPVFCDECAIYSEVGNTNLFQIESPELPDTLDYFSRLAFAQWTEEEIAEGEAWEFIENYL